MHNLFQDLRLAFRFLRKSPAFTTVAVLTLGLGIAANITVFRWIDAILLRPIPGVTHPEELTALEPVLADGARLTSSTHPDFRDFQSQLTLASGVVATHNAFFTIGPDDRPRRALGQVVSANFFAVLGVKPYLGRLFLAQEDRDDRGAFPMAVVSYRLWKDYFRSDPRLAGRIVRINGRQLTIVGVTPPDFLGTIGGAAMDVWVPLSMATQLGTLNTWAATDRNARFLEVVVRLRPGVSVLSATAEARAIASRIAAAYPATHRGVSASIVSIRDAGYGLQKNLGDPLKILMGVCLLVLIIACANVANLLMSRSVTRQREFGVRLALGAGRGNLVRLVVLEAALLAAVGAAAGALLAQWCGESMALVLPALDSSVRAAVDPLFHPSLNLNVLIFCVLVAALATVISVILPSLFVWRLDGNEARLEGGRSGMTGAGTHRARAAVVVLEVALAAVAVIGAGVAVRTFQKFAGMNPGFNTNNVVLAHFYLSTNGYSLKQEKLLSQELRRRLESTPGILQVASADSIPLSTVTPSRERVQVPGSLADEHGVASVSRSVVSPGYFKLMEIPLLAGRDFTVQDHEKAPFVIIVNQTFARLYFGGEDPIGRKVLVSGNPSTIVGLVRDAKYRSPQETPQPFFYGPFAQIFFSGHYNVLYLRPSGDPASAITALRKQAGMLGLGAGLYELSSLSNSVQAGLFSERVAASLLSALAILSLLLSAVGLYSVMAYAVSERTQEIGIRMALGAQPAMVLNSFLRQGLFLALGGLAAGVPCAIALARVLSTALKSTVVADEPAVFGGAALGLIFIALIACAIPAHRATRVDPVQALRSE